MLHHDPATVGDRGWALLDHAFEDGDPAAFAAAADLLREAVATGPGHPEEPWWHHGLRLAMGGRAESTGDVADWDAALEGFRRAWGQPQTDVERDVLAGLYAYTLLQQFLAVGDEGRAALDGLVDSLDALHEPGGRVVPAVDVLRGRVRLQRFGMLAVQSDHDEGLALLAAALPDAPDDTLLLAESWFDLAVFTEDAGAALGAVGRARRLMAPGDQYPDLDLLESSLLYSRWVSSADPGLLDDTLERLEQLCAASECPPCDALVSCGELRARRGSDTDSITDLDAAVGWLERAVPGLVGDDAAIAWMFLGTAIVQRARLTELAADRDRALHCLGTALGWGIPVPEIELDARHQRLEVLLVDLLADDPTDPVTATARDDLAAGLAALDRHPRADVECRAMLAMSLARTEAALVGHVDDPFPSPHTDQLIVIAVGHPAPPSGWTAAVSMLRSLVQYTDDTVGRAEGDFGRSHVVDALREAESLQLGLPQLRPVLGMMSMMSGGRVGDLGLMDTGSTMLGGGGGSLGSILTVMAELQVLLLQGADTDTMLAVVDRAIAAVDVTGGSWEDSWVREYLVPLLHAMREAGAPSGRALPELPLRTIDSPLTRAMAAMVDIARSGAAVAADPDPHRQVQALADMAERARAMPAASNERGLAADVLVSLWLARAERTGSPLDTEQAIIWSGELMAFLGGPDHVLWVRCAMNVARAHRLRGTAGDRIRGRELGQDVLRGHAWRVLLQSGTEHAITVARTASADAVRVARWCLHDGDSEGLVAALDAGRGLVLHAAVTARGVGEQLRSTGETGLAREWADAGGADRIALAGAPDVDLHGDLRRRVLKALGAGRSPLLDPPSIGRTRAALAAGDADALIYLVPADDGDPGLAVVVPAREPVVVIELPHLDAAAAVTLADRALPGAGRDIGPADAGPRPGQPADLTDWAWRVAGHALGDIAGRLRRPDGGWPRLLLVPFGALARVPWHAAGRLPELAVVSAVPSARLLCEATSRPAWAGGAQLVVGNPTGDLRGAGVEARAVTAAFYPSATYLGEDASAAAVLERLGTGTPPLALLHLACHGHADPSAPGRSHLRLADRALGVDEVLALRPTAPLDVGTVCLAACSTNVPGADYDEAFSLAAAFLAAGARTVFASMWPVPDDHTSRLMFMVHHYLAGEGCAPAEALHRARRWALDPHRVAPGSMPAALLAGMDGAGDAVAWAGFQHLGA